MHNENYAKAYSKLLQLYKEADKSEVYVVANYNCRLFDSTAVAKRRLQQYYDFLVKNKGQWDIFIGAPTNIRPVRIVSKSPYIVECEYASSLSLTIHSQNSANMVMDIAADAGGLITDLETALSTRLMESGAKIWVPYPVLCHTEANPTPFKSKSNDILDLFIKITESGAKISLVPQAIPVAHIPVAAEGTMTDAVVGGVAEAAPVISVAPVAAPVISVAPVAAPVVSVAPVAAPVVSVAPVAQPIIPKPIIQRATNTMMNTTNQLYFINLEKRQDRLKRILADFKDALPTNYRLARWHATPHAAGWIGCIKSHGALLRHLLETTNSGVYPVLEDDCLLYSKPDFKENLNLYIDYLKAHQGEWDVFVGGGIHPIPNRIVCRNPFIIECSWIMCAHFDIHSDKSARNVVNFAESGTYNTSIDNFIAKTHRNRIWVPYPLFCGQHMNDSDISNSDEYLKNIREGLSKASFILDEFVRNNS